ncbi:LytR C-terminal domain-containing protein [Actinoplanes flavus]|uniref:LytR C-terminal domain-containing protein n=1 Tax=Actinoplanes flavus TaxID=2820290 RepID=A0ABS3UWX5_9ACTN|nr:LytR C-terminal domain-containing protein [Actinoplanes flavus]MBO3743086.1 LytR C-terminal domain-containing protein [Actinoplanes flavus]
MSHGVPERVRELADDVQDLRMKPAAEVRARGRARGRRQLAASATAAAAVVAVSAGVAVAWPRQGETSIPPAGPAPLTCELLLPDSPADVQVRVPDAGIASELRERGFTVLDGAVASEAATTLTYGPAAIGRATLLRAAVHGEVTMRFEPGRPGPAIDLAPGPDFDRLATATELNQNLVSVGMPTAPPECP